MNHASSNYKDLSYLIGRPLELKEGIQTYAPVDGGVEIIADYKTTVLIEMTFIKSYWGLQIPPRKRRMLIQKADMRTGAVKLMDKRTKKMLTGEVISEYISEEEAKRGISNQNSAFTWQDLNELMDAELI